VYEQQFDEEAHLWQPFDPEKAFTTNVEVPEPKQLLGFESGAFNGSEPGPFRIFAVYSCEAH
jgi:hypothetical protein